MTPRPATPLATLLLLAPAVAQEPIAGSAETGAAGAAASSPAPQTAPTPELPPGIAARIGPREVTFDEFAAHLIELSGRRPLQDLIDNLLIEAEAERQGIEIPEAELALETERFRESMLVRHRGDEAQLASDLAGEGFTVEEYLARFRATRRIELLADRLCLATRTPSAEDIQERFERDYGVDGVRVEVRHVYLNAARLRQELAREGLDARQLSQEDIERRIRAVASEALERIRSGEEFATVAREVSHDLSVHQNDGFIPGYNYRRYGPELAQAVRDAEVGVPTGPVRTSAGLHVIEVTERTHTALADVRDEVLETLRSTAPSANERHALKLELRAAQPIQLY